MKPRSFSVQTRRGFLVGQILELCKTFFLAFFVRSIEQRPEIFPLRQQDAL
jgi:hypothetical protein